jgi:hypothetical protein
MANNNREKKEKKKKLLVFLEKLLYSNRLCDWVACW